MTSKVQGLISNQISYIQDFVKSQKYYNSEITVLVESQRSLNHELGKENDSIHQPSLLEI